MNGAAKDVSAALDLAQRAAKRSDPYSLFIMGLLYENGVGVTKDLDKAIDYYKSSAAYGFQKAQGNLDYLGYKPPARSTAPARECRTVAQEFLD